MYQNVALYYIYIHIVVFTQKNISILTFINIQIANTNNACLFVTLTYAHNIEKHTNSHTKKSTTMLIHTIIT
jgi:hypothetical protein